jgi:hypothetical protein
MIEVLGWGSPIGLGIFLACLGVFFWGAHFHQHGKWNRKDKE